MTELKNRIKNKINTDFRSNIVDFPKKNLLIEVTNCCNNKCIFCYNDCMKRQKKFIDSEFCKKILKEAYLLGMREVGFYVTGEPFLNSKLDEYVFFAKNQGYEYIYLTTNGILADLKSVKKLYDCGLNSIKYSINATNEDDYKKIHGTDNYEKVIKNLTDVYNWKKSNKKNINIYVSFIKTNISNNKKEIEKLFLNKCDEIVIMSAINQGGLIPNITEISHRQLSDINGNFKLPCSYPFNSVIVTVEGYLTACCMDFENLLAYADLNKHSLKESWNNELIKEFRNRHINKNVKNSICQNCIFNTYDVPEPLNKNLCKLNEIDNSIFCKTYK